MKDKSAIKLSVTAGPMKGKEFVFEEHDVFVLGRAPDCHCRLPDDQCVSRHHFLLEANPPDCCIQDLGSLNGTFINGKKYGGREPGELPEVAARRNKPVEIKHADEIRIGGTILAITITTPVVCAKCGKAIDRAEAQQPAEGALICRACAAKPMNKQEELLAKIVAGARKEAGKQTAIPGYRIEKKLGEGGMGQVFLAHSEKLNRAVALKTMLPRKSVITEADVKRFLREMATCAALRHPNVVTFVDQGYVNGVFYFAMEYCKDGSVQDLLERATGKLPVAESVGIIRQVLEGLGYAHKQGIVHRDLKPANILLVSVGSNLTAMIADFGLAKNFQQAGLSGMTMSGMYSGTLPFMPPEQVINFRDVKPVSDIFAVGATLYVMLTGQCAYGFVEGEEPIKAILEKRIVPIRKRGVKLPAKLADAVDRAVAPEPKDRFQTAGEFKEALR